MPRYQYASGRTSLPFVAGNVTVTTGGSIATSGTLYLAINGRNPAGVNLASPIVPVAYTAGSRIIVTIPDLTDGEFYEQIVLSGAATNSAAAMVQLAVTDANSLPDTITLSSPSHIALSATVADPASLPTDPIDGMKRGVTSLGRVFEFFQGSTRAANGTTILTASTGRWFQVPAFSTYVAATTDPGGCDTPLSLITENTLTIPRYAVDGGNGQEKTYWIVNTEGSPIEAGKKLVLSATLNDAPKSGLFSGLIEYKLSGFAKQSDGSLRVTDNTTGLDLIGLDTWTPIENQATDILISDDLEPGECLTYSLRPRFSAVELNGDVTQDSVLKAVALVAPQMGVYDSTGYVTGDLILTHPEIEFDRRRVLPNTGLSVTLTKGSGTVYRRVWVAVGAQVVSNLQSNTNNQIIAINANGSGFAVTALRTGDAKRAVVGTVAGSGAATAWETGIPVSGSQGLEILVSHPTTIRANYPDLIAGATCDPNGATLTVLVRSGGTIKRFSGIGFVSGDEFTTINLGNVWASAPTGTVPAPAANFSLFTPTGTDSEASGVGDFPAGTVDVAVFYSYDGNQVTRISHSTNDGCIPEADGTFNELFSTITALQSALTNLNKVAVSETDPSVDYLENKLVAGDGIEINSDGTTITISQGVKSRTGYFMGFFGFTYHQ